MPTVKFFRPKGDLTEVMFTDDYDGYDSYLPHVQRFLENTDAVVRLTRDGIEVDAGWSFNQTLIDKDTAIVKAYIGDDKPLVLLYKADYFLRSNQEICTVQHSEPTMDLDEIMWQTVKQAAADAPWMPPEYMMNDWVSDVCDFLRNRHLYQKVE